MSTLSEAYNNFINTGTTGTRPGGDKINISFTSGKKSNKDILEQLQIAAAEREAAEKAATPIDADAQRLQWEREDQALQAEAAKRSGAESEQQLALQLLQEQRSAAQAALAEESGRYELAQARKGEAAKAEAQRLANQGAQLSNIGSSVSNKRAGIAYANEAAQRAKQVEAERQLQLHKYDRTPIQYYQTIARNQQFQAANPFTGRAMGAFERNTGQDPQSVLSRIQRGESSPSMWESAYNVIGPEAASSLWNTAQANKMAQRQAPQRHYNTYGF